MDIRLTDCSRNVAIVPRHGPPFADPFATMDDLLARNPPQHGQGQFVMDGEFLRALEAFPNGGEPRMTKAHEPLFEGHHGEYRGVHIVVAG